MGIFFYKSINRILAKEDEFVFLDTLLLEQGSHVNISDHLQDYQSIAMIVLLGPKLKHVQHQIQEDVKKLISEQLHIPSIRPGGDNCFPKPRFIASCSVFGPKVKQAKKSSNKWVCAVCNQKHSVRRVFAKGFMAKNIRQFVQKFNMSRQSSDKKEIALKEGDDTFEEEGFSSMEDQKKKRTDWAEYMLSMIRTIAPKELRNVRILGMIHLMRRWL